MTDATLDAPNLPLPTTNDVYHPAVSCPSCKTAVPLNTGIMIVCPNCACQTFRLIHANAVSNGNVRFRMQCGECLTLTGFLLVVTDNRVAFMPDDKG